jgi:hypothetical protein
VANNDYIERLKQVIFHLHGSDSSHVESVPVHEVFRGQTLWQGIVEVFDLTGHPKASRAYAWSYMDGATERFVAVLGLPPITSPENAVKASVAETVKKARAK